VKEHEAEVTVRVGVVTISTSKWKKYGSVGLEGLKDIDDESGKFIVDSLTECEIVGYRLVPDNREKILGAVLELLDKADVVITTGGTGITPTDVTIEAIEPIVSKKLEGFGEIFRMLSYKEVGSAAILSRAFAGVADGKVVFCLPGSTKAVRLAMEIVKPALRHVVSHARGLR
jgi:molybdenum cofactor biosynthesis protein B